MRLHYVYRNVFGRQEKNNKPVNFSMVRILLFVTIIDKYRLDVAINLVTHLVSRTFHVNFINETLFCMCFKIQPKSHSSDESSLRKNFHIILFEEINYSSR